MSLSRAEVGGVVPHPLGASPSSPGSLSFAHKAKRKLVEKKGSWRGCPTSHQLLVSSWLQVQNTQLPDAGNTTLTAVLFFFFFKLAYSVY